MSEKLGLRLPLFCAALLSISATASAQTKVAIIHLQRAVFETAEIKKANIEMEGRYKPRQQQMAAVEKEIQSLQQMLQANAGKLTQQAEADVSMKGQRLQRDLKRMSDDLQADVERDRNDILSKSSQRMQEVVKKLAEEKGLDVVVDVSNTVYFKPALEITTEAIAAFDKAYPVK